MRVATRVPVALPALFSAGYLAAYLLPTLTGRLAADFHLTTTQSGASGSLLLLGSASAGLLLAVLDNADEPGAGAARIAGHGYSGGEGARGSGAAACPGPRHAWQALPPRPPGFPDRGRIVYAE